MQSLEILDPEIGVTPNRGSLRSVRSAHRIAAFAFVPSVLIGYVSFSWRQHLEIQSLQLAVSSTLLADWTEALERADLLYTTSEKTVEYRPEVGNGFVATVVGSETIYAAGVYNGKALDPSHRARIPAPLALVVGGDEVTPLAAALDLRRAVYLRRYSLESSEAMVQLRFYAHRTRRSLLVVELSALGLLEEPLNVTISGGGGLNVTSDDFNWTSRNATLKGDRQVIIWTGETKESELPTSSTVRVAVVFTQGVSNQAITLQPGPITFLASIRTSLESDDPEAAAISDYLEGVEADPEELFTEHEEAWSQLWDSGFEVTGRVDVARAVNSSLYYLLSSVREDTKYSLSPGGLASNSYNGHVFWDCETWMFPSLLFWHPQIASSLLDYRLERVDEAQKKAENYKKNYTGAMFPWESAYTGVETCPPSASTGQLEQHITGDIAFAARQFWYLTRNLTWLQHSYEGLVKKTADFWTSRVTWKHSWLEKASAHIDGVIPPDEYATGDDSIYTNYVAKQNLLFAIAASGLVNDKADPEWEKISSSLSLPFDFFSQRHPEYEGYHGQKIKQADVVLLGYPLMMEMPEKVRRNDLEYYESRTDENGPAMTWAMHFIGHSELGDSAKASENFNRSFANVKEPFYVWSETPSGGAVNFLTGAGGFLQTTLFGLAGIRLLEDKLTLKPSLTEGMTSFKARGVHYLNSIFSIAFDGVQTTLTLTSGRPLSVKDSDGKLSRLAMGQPLILSAGSLEITSEDSMVVNA